MMSPSADRCRRAGEGQPRSSGLRAENPTCRGSHTVRGPNRRRDSPQHSPRQNPRLENSGRGHQRPASLGRTDWCCFDALNLSNTPQSASGRPLPWPSSPLGSVGDAYDNVLTESIIDLYKAECIDTDIFHAGLYKSVGEVEYATAGWVEWYNHRQLHSSLSSANRVRTIPLCCPQTPGAANMKAAQKPGRFVLREVKCRRQLGFDHRPAAITVRRDADAAAARGGAHDLRWGGIGLRSVRPPDTV
jgi:hypothetical protein